MENIYRYFTTIKENDQIRSLKQYEESEKKILEMEQRTKEISSPMEKISYSNQVTAEFRKTILRCPEVLIAICPFCFQKIWAKIQHGVFTLNSSFWVMEYDDAKPVSDDSKCEHLIFVDGVLHLNGNSIPEKIKPYSFIRTKIYMGAEVPFIKPRMLEKESMIAIIHSLEIAGKYTAYPITYFSKISVPQKDFATGWAREEYCAINEIAKETTFSGKRKEPQDYSLLPWVMQKKIGWLTEKNNEPTISFAPDIFPYAKIEGRKHPYYIQDGKIIDLPNQEKEELSTIVETFMPG